jgi:hypothetical protein
MANGKGAGRFAMESSNAPRCESAGPNPIGSDPILPDARFAKLDTYMLKAIVEAFGVPCRAKEAGRL